MALGGVSVSDLKTYGFNTAVYAGVVGGCAAVAWLVKKLALMGLERISARTKQTTNETKEDKEARHEKYASRFALVVATTVAAAAYKFIPASRFALDDSNSKAFKIGVIQLLFGFIVDCYFTKGFYNGMALGVGATAATRFATLALPAVAGFGTFGALLGTGYLSRSDTEKK